MIRLEFLKIANSTFFFSYVIYVRYYYYQSINNDFQSKFRQCILINIEQHIQKSETGSLQN